MTGKLFEDSETDDSGDESPEGAASRIARSRKQLANRKIEELLKPGQNVLCQVTKDPIGLKGARVTGYLSLPGRYSVFMPHVAQVGVCKRIGSDKERRRLRDLVNEARPKGTGFIVRTAAEDAIDQELRDDVDFLARLWGEIARREQDMTRARPGLRRSRSGAALCSRPDARGHLGDRASTTTSSTSACASSRSRSCRGSPSA